MMSPQWTIYGVWNFSKNVEAAKQFLVDYKHRGQRVSSQRGYDIPFEKGLQNTPLPVLSTDEKTKGVQEAYKYVKVIGYPGPNTVLANKALDLHIMADMFTRYATGTQSADQTIKEAVDAYKQIISAPVLQCSGCQTLRSGNGRAVQQARGTRTGHAAGTRVRQVALLERLCSRGRIPRRRG